MTFKQKIIFIISLAFFQIFYLLSNYTGQYLNSFFLLTCLTAAILCYNLYQLLMQLFTSEKVEAELNLLKKQQLLNSEHLLLMNQQEATSLKAQKQFSENLQSIQKLLHENDCENAQKLVYEVLEAFQRDRFHPYCEDNLILAILESKRLFAQHLGIHTDYKIFLPEKSNIQSSDLCSVLFNILDNAIEACIRLQHQDPAAQPSIVLSMKPFRAALQIIVQNTSTGEYLTDKDHALRTSKADTSQHGFGLLNVQKTVEAANGIIDITINSTSFCVTILIPEK